MKNRFVILFIFIAHNVTMAETLIHEQIEKLNRHRAVLVKKINDDKNTKQIPCTGRVAKKALEQFPLIRERLILKGYLDNKNNAASIHDDAIKKTLQKFQEHHFIEQSGVFGPKTCAALNETLADDIKLIDINIKRLEKIKDDAKNAKKLIFVNVAQYKLFALHKGNVDLSMDVIVGTPERRTIIGHDHLTTVVLNPTWVIPRTILVQDKLPKFSENPEYLEKMNFTVLDENRNILQPHTVNWQDVAQNPLSYRFRQEPGKSNVLGDYKFLLTNPQAIYLHDTNARHLFDKPTRALSSGCIRLKDPGALAQWLLMDYGQLNCPKNKDGSSKYTVTCVQGVVGDTKKQSQQRFFKLSDHVPVVLGYITYWIGDDGHAYKSDDPYGQDDQFLELSLAELASLDI